MGGERKPLMCSPCFWSPEEEPEPIFLSENNKVVPVDVDEDEDSCSTKTAELEAEFIKETERNIKEKAKLIVALKEKDKEIDLLGNKLQNKESLIFELSSVIWRIVNQQNIHMFNPYLSSLPIPIPYPQSHWPLYQQLPPPPQHYQNSLMQTSPWLSHLPSSSQQNAVCDINRVSIFSLLGPRPTK